MAKERKRKDKLSHEQWPQVITIDAFNEDGQNTPAQGIFHNSCGSSFVPSLKGHGPLLGTEDPRENYSSERRCLSMQEI